MIFKILFFGFLTYLSYRLVFHFILPIYRTTRQVKRGFSEMNERMNQHYANQNQQQQEQQTQAHSNNNGKGKVGEYIDFEEIK